MNPHYIIIFILILLLILSLYIIIQKDEQIRILERANSDLKQSNNFFKSENDRLVGQLRVLSDDLLEREMLINNLSLELNISNRNIQMINRNLSEWIDKYLVLESRYNSTKMMIENLTSLNNLISEIEYRLDWLDLNYFSISDRYISLRREIVDNCVNGTVLDMACSYIIITEYMNESSINITDIHTALRNRNGDCVVFSILIDRLLKDIKPSKIRVLERSRSMEYSLVVKNIRYNIKNYKSTEIDYNNSRVVCYGIQNKGHCSIGIGNTVVDYSMGVVLGTIGDNLDICQKEACKWRQGWITMQILENDILYLNQSLRGILSNLR